MLFVTGCGKYGEKEFLRDLNKNINNLNAYYLEYPIDPFFFTFFELQFEIKFLIKETE